MDDEKAKELGLWCPFWGAIGPGPVHMDCGVILKHPDSSALKASALPPIPFVCMCDCSTCKNVWWAAGRPTNKSMNGSAT